MRVKVVNIKTMEVTLHPEEVVYIIASLRWSATHGEWMGGLAEVWLDMANKLEHVTRVEQ